MRAKHIGFYNGMNVANSNYAIGVSSSWDGVSFSRSVTPLLLPRPGLFDSHGLNAPHPVQVGDQIHVYYAGFNGTAYNGIGVAVLNPDLTIVERPRAPILGFSGTGWESAKIFRPFVILDEVEVDPAKRFKMFYTGAGSDGKNYSGIAFSPDGIKGWVRYSGNPVLSPSGSGWDSLWTMAEHVSKIGTEYVMLYNGYDGVKIQTGYATSASLLGPWSKSAANPILSPRPLANQALAAPVAKGSNVITMMMATAFSVGEPIFIASSSGVENLRVKAIVNPTTITTTELTTMAHPTGSVASVLSGSTGPNQLVYDGTTYRVFGSAWNAVTAYEVTTLAEGPSLDALQWKLDAMPVMNFSTLPTSDWDSRSQENLKFL